MEKGKVNNERINILPHSSTHAHIDGTVWIDIRVWHPIHFITW